MIRPTDRTLEVLKASFDPDDPTSGDRVTRPVVPHLPVEHLVRLRLHRPPDDSNRLAIRNAVMASD